MTEIFNNSPFCIDPHKISSVSTFDNEVRVTVSGSGYYFVKESLEEVVKMIEGAIA